MVTLVVQLKYKDAIEWKYGKLTPIQGILNECLQKRFVELSKHGTSFTNMLWKPVYEPFRTPYDSKYLETLFYVDDYIYREKFENPNLYTMLNELKEMNLIEHVFESSLKGIQYLTNVKHRSTGDLIKDIVGCGFNEVEYSINNNRKVDLIQTEARELIRLMKYLGEISLEYLKIPTKILYENIWDDDKKKKFDFFAKENNIEIGKLMIIIDADNKQSYQTLVENCLEHLTLKGDSK